MKPRLQARDVVFAVITLAVASGVVACGQPEDDIVGNWRASDGTTKTIDAAGNCTGMFWNDGQPLDVGGPMTCSFSQQKDDSGDHALVVTQPPNQETLVLRFLDPDTVEVHQDGDLVVTLERL